VAPLRRRGLSGRRREAARHWPRWRRRRRSSSPTRFPPPPTIVTVIAPPAPPPNADTILGFHPSKTIKTDKKKVKVKFTFSSSVAEASFNCKLDKGAFAPCTSPKTYKVKLGQHKFSVETILAGVADPSPAIFPFKVKKKAIGAAR
jgi:hypothetical protein